MLYTHMVANRRFVVVGMSFECETDRFLLHALGKAEDEMPISESTWPVVNRNPDALEKACDAILAHLPRADVVPVQSRFSDWEDDGYRELWEMA
jgi:hypothetical protein